MAKLYLNSEEPISFSLRAIYEEYGYTRYKMSKFEEYDLYARFGDALTSEGVITFNNPGGKLMALKPDVTLSIIKNGRNTQGVQKVYYDEKVYRVPKGADEYREISQVGLECMGDIDLFSVAEVLRLAGESMRAIDRAGVLDVCHMGIPIEIMEECGLPTESRREIIALLGEKNSHELRAACERAGMDPDNVRRMMALCSTYGTSGEVLNRLGMMLGQKYYPQLREIWYIMDTLPMEIACKVKIDFSAGTEYGYYNGMVFKGYVPGIPTPVLSGGQYDRLMKKMGREGGAVGFAVYPDYLQRNGSAEDSGPDTVLYYKKTNHPSDVAAIAEYLRLHGYKVMTAKETDTKINFKNAFKIEKGEAKKIEKKRKANS